ncbi:hypothetical protein ACFXPS_25620 [Nocardia sp. NPDC059091]|uniref:hypothetical protein n=1 Tax=unclassified Nocardia TaxID=2637762 RepID=UPI0036995DC8
MHNEAHPRQGRVDAVGKQVGDLPDEMFRGVDDFPKAIAATGTRADNTHDFFTIGNSLVASGIALQNHSTCASAEANMNQAGAHCLTAGCSPAGPART